MSCRSPKNVIVANRATERFARRCENLPLGREYRSVDRPSELCPSVSLRVFTCLYVSLRVFTVREGEGSRGNLRGSKRRYQESPRKGPGQNAENPTFATYGSTNSVTRGRGRQAATRR
jgi:hypothetical protein